MTDYFEQRVLRTNDEYRRALRRSAALRDQGRRPEDDAELAAIEGAIAEYVAKPGVPARRRGRPKDSGNGA